MLIPESFQRLRAEYKENAMNLEEKILQYIYFMTSIQPLKEKICIFIFKILVNSLLYQFNLYFKLSEFC